MIMTWLCVQIAGVDYLYFIQKNSLDRRERTLHIEAYNESFSSRVNVYEHCCYTVCAALSLQFPSYLRARVYVLAALS